MAQLTSADLKEFPSFYDSPRDIGDVLIGEDTARPLIEASSSGNDTALQSLLSQPQWIKIMLEKPHRIYELERDPSASPNGLRRVQAMRISNLEQALIAAAVTRHATTVSTLLAFAKQQGISASSILSISTMNKIIRAGDVAVMKALVSADPEGILNFRLGHGGELPLYEAVRLRQHEIVALLLEFGADPLHPARQGKVLGTYRSSLMSFAAFAGTRMTEMLLERGVPVANTGALHSAASAGRLDTMELLMQHGADVNEVIWRNWTPMHFAAWRGRVEAMKLLEDSGARSDAKDEDGKTPAQVLEERNAAKD